MLLRVKVPAAIYENRKTLAGETVITFVISHNVIIVTRVIESEIKVGAGGNISWESPHCQMYDIVGLIDYLDRCATGTVISVTVPFARSGGS